MQCPPFNHALFCALWQQSHRATSVLCLWLSLTVREIKISLCHLLSLNAYSLCLLWLKADHWGKELQHSYLQPAKASLSPECAPWRLFDRQQSSLPLGKQSVFRDHPFLSRVAGTHDVPKTSLEIACCSSAFLLLFIFCICSFLHLGIVCTPMMPWV